MLMTIPVMLAMIPVMPRKFLQAMLSWVFSKNWDILQIMKAGKPHKIGWLKILLILAISY